MREVYILLTCQLVMEARSKLEWKQLPRKLPRTSMGFIFQCFRGSKLLYIFSNLLFTPTSTIRVGRDKVLPEATILPLVSVPTGCRLLRCSWHEIGQPTNTNRTGFRHRHTQRDILTDHAWQSSTQEHSGDATRWGGSIMVFVLFLCTLSCVISASYPTGSRQAELAASGYAKGDGW